MLSGETCHTLYHRDDELLIANRSTGDQENEIFSYLQDRVNCHLPDVPGTRYYYLYTYDSGREPRTESDGTSVCILGYCSIIQHIYAYNIQIQNTSAWNLEPVGQLCYLVLE